MAKTIGKKADRIYSHMMMEFPPSEAVADIPKQSNSSQTPITDKYSLLLKSKKLE